MHNHIQNYLDKLQNYNVYFYYLYLIHSIILIAKITLTVIIVIINNPQRQNWVTILEIPSNTETQKWQKLQCCFLA